MKNMTPKVCLFRRDGGIYTLNSYAQDPSFLVKWNMNDRTGKYEAQRTEQVFTKPSTGMKAMGQQLCVSTNTGQFVMVAPDTLKPEIVSKKLHKFVPMSCALVYGDVVMTVCTDYSYYFTPLSDFSWMNWIKSYIIQFAIFFLFMLWLVDYIY